MVFSSKAPTSFSRGPLALMRVEMNKTIKILILGIALIGQKSFAQSDSINLENVRDFFNSYVNFSERHPNAKNDTIINLFFIRDTLEARLKEGRAMFGCARYNLNNLYMRYENRYNFNLDSVFKSKNEDNIYYLRLKSSHACPYYEFYKILFIRARYYIIPGHGNEDICFGASWAFYNCYSIR